ncbi:MAG: hypothetical protein L0387_21565 [Acidobacteria bacterium]|nr:hypothetical protein [Acidobacteriota bacterium]
MRRWSVALGLALCLALPMAAQEASLTSAGTVPSAPQPKPQSSSEDLYPWQVGAGYEYLRVDSGGGVHFGLHGYTTSATRYFNDWAGVEAGVSGAFGSPFGISTRWLWYGAGPKIAWRYHSRIHPWGHFLLGGARIRVVQTAGVPAATNSFSWVAGGGADIRINARLAWRVEADYVNTRFSSTTQHNMRYRSGIALNF